MKEQRLTNSKVAFPKKKRAGTSLLHDDYFRIRDFEYVQPLYDLAFLLEVSALAKGTEVPKFRTFSLWRAAYSLDGYGTTIDRWLDGADSSLVLDYAPTHRIRDYLKHVRKTGSLPELKQFKSRKYDFCLRLRAVRGLGPSQIAMTLSKDALADPSNSRTAINLDLEREQIAAAYSGKSAGQWQSPHIIPPLLRFLNAIEAFTGTQLGFEISGIPDVLGPVGIDLLIGVQGIQRPLNHVIDGVLKSERLFRKGALGKNSSEIEIRHQMGWSFRVTRKSGSKIKGSIRNLAHDLDPLSNLQADGMIADLHTHSAWSDGSASIASMAQAAETSGLKYFAVTDHSRSSKLQGGLTPVLWLRQAQALKLNHTACRPLHGIEVDILRDGTLDLPISLLSAADLVVGSVHTAWSSSPRENTDRLLRAIESGGIDILAHPTSAVRGKPGVPDYIREPAEIYWEEVFHKCADWQVALEFNCFPSRFDLPIPLLRQAVALGCAISFGSDAHARSHLTNLRFGDRCLAQLSANTVLNRLTLSEFKAWISKARKQRRNISRNYFDARQSEFAFEAKSVSPARLLEVSLPPSQELPAGSKVVGIDLTAGKKPTGLAILDGLNVEAKSLTTDEDIVELIRVTQPRIVSIDSPLGLPGGGKTINRKAGIVRVAEQDLASVGISAYPALIDSMKQLTLRGIRLRTAIESLPFNPQVIESYPGAAQDILSIPRKQKSMDLLREGLQRLGLKGSGLQTHSHDEMDAITSAVVGRYFEAGLYEPMGIPSEAQLIVPKVPPLVFEQNPLICLAGKTGAGKSVAARYLSVFYGFTWIRTRDIIKELLIEDLAKTPRERIFDKCVNPSDISEVDLRAFGTIILDRFRQEPVQQKLGSIVQRNDCPLVIDSIRELSDISSVLQDIRPILIWSIDCNESLLRSRLAERAKFGKRRPKEPSPVDKTAGLIREHSDMIIPNSGSLEEFRWRLDDALFQNIHLNI